ncbi:sugar ABC transporter substrate-binding protein [Amycolatopsis thailandensis]|uniref:sugar ABC transporter substrate-binding protein n=1 Tax=Amycolatopsis thailandensis TaxID=589330 RepID=UPI00364E9089
MKTLDRDRTPVRFTVLTSVTGGLVLAGILALLRGDALIAKVPAWTVLAAGSLAAIPLMLRRAPWTRRPRQAFLVTSAFSQKYWVAGFVQRVHVVLDRSGIDLVLKVPDRDYDAAAQAHHLRRILAARRGYLGGVIVATEVHRLRPDLVEFCSELALPVVFTDIEPFDDEADYPANTTFVGYLSRDLGNLAGRWLVTHFRQRGTRRPHVLIVASQQHPARQDHCASVLRTELTDVSITIDDSCAFQRPRAYDAVQSHIRLLAAKQGHLDAVFCTNDEMALGAVDALRATTSPVTADTVVIGVDGTTEARTLIDTGTSPLRATVVQDSHSLAESVVHALESMHERGKATKRTVLTPEIYEIK